MAEQYTRDVDERRTSKTEEGHKPGQEHFSAPDTMDARDVGSMLSNSRLDGRGSAPQRGAALLQMQQTHGNRAVQRFIQRSPANGAAPLPVQRQEGEGEPFVPKFSPLPYPKLELPFGGGFGLGADPSEASLNWSSKDASAKLAYQYGGGVSAEGKYKNWWGKGTVGGEGFGIGLGYGNPLLTPPGMPPMLNDPSGDLREGSLDPRVIGKSLGEMSEYKSKPGWSFGAQGGVTPDLGAYGMLGVGYSF